MPRPTVSAEAVLALDVGTSSCRASLYDMRGRRIVGPHAQVTYAPRTTADGGAELDADWLFDQVCHCIDTVLSGPTPRIVCIATTTFWHSLIGLDDTGRPVTPVYLWMDARSRDDVAHLRQILDERAVHARVGCVLHWSYWPAKLAWLRRTRSALVQNARRWASFGELLLQRLTGLTATSVSMASGTGLLNTHTCDWDQPLLDALRIDRDVLPDLVPLAHTAASTPPTRARWPKLAAAAWLAPVGDGACSNLGAGCTTSDRCAVMIGTSGAERVVWAPPQAFVIPWGTWCYRIDERRTVLGGALNDGGSLFEWLRESLRLPSITSVESAMYSMEADAHGLTVLPFWAGERSPGWADDARGAIIGLRLHTRPEHIVRAALEAIALRFSELDQILMGVMPDAREVIATGGALLHSPTWLQIMADVLGRPVLASAEPEASSRGASLLALEVMGRLSQPLETLRPATRQHLTPNPANTARYMGARERQRRLYAALVHP